MEKQEIIRYFLEKGYQLDLASLDFFSRNLGKIDTFLEKMENTEKPSIITLDFINSILKTEMSVDVIRTPRQLKKASVQDFVQYFSNRYEKLRNIVIKRLNSTNLISIGKISPKTKRFSIIGLVKEKNNEEKSIKIEDPTSEVSIFFEDNSDQTFEQIVLDEVIGITCEKDDIIRAKEVIWPDIPLERKIAKTENGVFCLFLSDIHMDNKEFNKKSYEKFLEWINKLDYDKLYVFVLGYVSSKKQDLIAFFNNLPKNSLKIFLRGKTDPDVVVGDLKIESPALIRLEGNVTFLLCDGTHLEQYADFWKNYTPDKIMLNLLRKRHINPVFDFNKKIYVEDPFLLDTIPDIFASGHFHSPSFLNYKGTTIISTGNFISKPIYWLANLKTREIIKLDFT